VRKFAQVFHVGAIIELIENDDLMNEQEEEEEEEVKFNKLSVVFHPKKEREKERKREKETHIIIAVKNLIDPVCLKTNDAKETTEERPSTEKNYKHSADDNDVNDDDDKEEEEDRFFAHLAVRVLLREEDGHVGGDKASPAGD